MSEPDHETQIETPYTPHNEGKEARLKGVRRSENPWAVNNWKHYEWQEGWDTVDTTIKQKPPLSPSNK